MYSLMLQGAPAIGQGSNISHFRRR